MGVSVTRFVCGYRDGRVARRSAGGGFTLIELLVVIAIIALLAAMLAPSLGRIAERSRTLTCQTRLEQIGKAAHAYKTDNNNRLMKLKYTLDDGTKGTFAHKLQKYLNSWKLFECPSQVEAYYNSPGGKRLDYGLNHYGRGDNNTEKYYDTFSNLWAHKTKVTNVVYLADAEADQSPHDIGGASRGTLEWPIKWSFQRYAYKRHLGGYNAVYLGGSAWYRPDAEQVPYNEEWFIPKQKD